MKRYHQLVLTLYLPSFLFFFSQGVLIPVLPLYILDQGVSIGVVGLALAGQPIGMLLGDLPSGTLIRRFGSLHTMVLGLVGFAAANAGMYMVSTIYWIAVLQLLTGFCTAVFTVGLHSSFIELSAVKTRGRTIAISGGIIRLGRFAGPIVGGIIATTFGLREPFLLLTLTSALAVAFVFTGERLKTNTPKADNVRPALPRQRLANVVRSNARILLSAGGGQLCAQAIRAARPILIPLFAAGNLGLGADSIGVIVGISAGLDMSLFFVSGWLMDNLGRKFAIIPSFAIQSAGIALIPFTTGFISLLVVVSLVGIGNGIGSGNMMTLGADLAPTDTRGEFLGVWRLIADCGQMGAPLTIGAVAELISLNAACVAISSVGFLGVLIFIFAVPETLNRQPVKLQ